MKTQEEQKLLKTKQLPQYRRNKDENLHRYAVRGVKDRKREVIKETCKKITNLEHSVKNANLS